MAFVVKIWKLTRKLSIILSFTTLVRMKAEKCFKLPISHPVTELFALSC